MARSASSRRVPTIRYSEPVYSVEYRSRVSARALARACTRVGPLPALRLRRFTLNPSRSVIGMAPLAPPTHTWNAPPVPGGGSTMDTMPTMGLTRRPYLSIVASGDVTRWPLPSVGAARRLSRRTAPGCGWTGPPQTGQAG